MQIENIIALGGIIAVFAFFSAIVVFGDLTWRGQRGGGREVR